MYEAELEKVTKKIDGIIKKGLLKEKKIYLFGVSDNTRQIIKILRENGYEPEGIVDNDRNKIGSCCVGIIVSETDKIPIQKDTVCFMYSFYHLEMKRQLLTIGLAENQIKDVTLKEPGLLRITADVIKGKRIYDSLITEFGDLPVFLCPYTGTGDIYLIGTFWDEYIKKEGLEDYIFVVISGACKKVAQLFHIKNVVCLSKQKDGGRLITYYSMYPDKVNMKLLNDAWAQINDNTTEWFRGYKGWYFTELFRKYVFDLPDSSKPRHPELSDATGELSKYFDANDLVPGKTVVLSPYSNTLSDMPAKFWENLCEGLIKKGYKVCTNSSGMAEPVIKGSIGIFFPLNIAPQFINKAGSFIGVRSGFCDIVSGANAKKVILYDKGNRFYNCSAFEYFSLKSMGLCEDAVEIEFEAGCIEDTCANILNYF